MITFRANLNAPIIAFSSIVNYLQMNRTENKYHYLPLFSQKNMYSHYFSLRVLCGLVTNRNANR